MIAFVNHWELLLILAVVLLLFGHRLPGMARSLGSGITEFKRGLKDGAEKGSAKMGVAFAFGVYGMTPMLLLGVLHVVPSPLVHTIAGLLALLARR